MYECLPKKKKETKKSAFLQRVFDKELPSFIVLHYAVYKGKGSKQSNKYF